MWPVFCYNNIMKKIHFDNSVIRITKQELAMFKKLTTPQKVQDFVSSLHHNFELNGDSCMSVREVLRARRGHCIEGAIVAALAFWVHGRKPLLLDLRAENDFDHVVALFKENGKWGAISKGNHAYTLYRDPVYRTVRELVMSYFHEYYNTKGRKTLRAFSRPFDLRRYKPEVWITGEGAWQVAEDIDAAPHTVLFSKKDVRNLRIIDEIETRVSKLVIDKR